MDSPAPAPWCSTPVSCLGNVTIVALGNWDLPVSRRSQHAVRPSARPRLLFSTELPRRLLEVKWACTCAPPASRRYVEGLASVQPSMFASRAISLPSGRLAERTSETRRIRGASTIGEGCPSQIAAATVTNLSMPPFQGITWVDPYSNLPIAAKPRLPNTVNQSIRRTTQEKRTTSIWKRPAPSVPQNMR
jgi:hypothetical protein